MEFRLPKADLLRALRLASSVADRKSTMPLLSNVLLRVSRKSLLVAATDLTVSLSAEVALDAKSKPVDGGVTLAARTLYELVSNAPGDEISVKRTDSNWCEIQSGRAKYKIAGAADRDFPKLPDHRETEATIVDAASLRQLVDRTLFSVCEDETRHHLNGVYLLTDGKTMTAVSTDGHRLSLATMPSTIKLPEPAKGAGIIVPRKGLVELKRLITDAESCSLAVKLPNLFVRVGDTTVGIKLIDGQFPPYEQVIPKSNGTAVTVDRCRLLEAVRRMQLMTTDSRGVKLAPADGGVQLTATDPDLGEVTEVVDCEVSGKMPTIGFNPKYVVDLLAQLSTDAIVLRLGGELDPILVEQIDDNSYSGVVMPMRVN